MKALILTVVLIFTERAAILHYKQHASSFFWHRIASLYCRIWALSLDASYGKPMGINMRGIVEEGQKDLF
jgi:hypothetical protein